MITVVVLAITARMLMIIIMVMIRSTNLCQSSTNPQSMEDRWHIGGICG